MGPCENPFCALLEEGHDDAPRPSHSSRGGRRKHRAGQISSSDDEEKSLEGLPWVHPGIAGIAASEDELAMVQTREAGSNPQSRPVEDVVAAIETRQDRLGTVVGIA